jgi:hypothetical protein
MKRNHWYILIAAALFVLSCDQVKDWRDPTDDVPPGPVANIRVENLNGGARIIYTLPDDDDLLGAKAVYTYHDGDEAREMYASAYTDTITLEGFGDTNPHLVHLYAIDKSGNVSAGMPVEIQPLTPPIHVIRQTLKVQEAFGGVYVTWENVDRNEIAVSLYMADAEGHYNLFDTYFSTAADGANRFRGIAAREQQFRIEIYDRWNNYAAPLDTAIVPIFEEEIFGRVNGVVYWKLLGMIDGSSVRRGDLTSYNPYTFDKIFDGDLFTNGTGTYWQSTNNASTFFPADVPQGSIEQLWPIYFTIDMGRRASYSTMKFWMRDRSSIGHIFSANSMTDFEIWATNNPKPNNQIGSGSVADNQQYWTSWQRVNGADEWKNDWELLATCRVRLPSGIAKSYGYLTLSDEDQQFVRDGFLFEMDPAMAGKAFRYLRFCITATNTDQAQLQMSEMRFWGSIEK